jgi:hypothetical protein
VQAVKRIAQAFFPIVFMVLFAAMPLAFGATATWAKRAAVFPSKCDDLAKCKPMRIPSPDGKSSVEVHYRKVHYRNAYKVEEKDDYFSQAYLRVKSPLNRTREAALPDGFQDIELLWSPDSKAFFINGGNGGGYWGFWVYVYLIDDPKLKPLDVTNNAQRDMVRSFPPCRAAYLDLKSCKATEANPEYNMSGIDWVPDSSAIVVMAEVPCSGTQGGIMCQVMGYELEVPSGRILKRMSARKFAANWQKSMGWKFQIPEPPEYCTKSSDRTLPACAGHDW